MKPDVALIIQGIEWNVFAEYDESYEVYVAHSINTGAVATGKTVDEAVDLIKQILEADIKAAIQQDDAKSLLHSCAPSEVRQSWIQAKTAAPDDFKRITLNISDLQKKGVQSELRVGRTREGIA